MPHLSSREIRLKNRPVGLPGPDTFELAEIELGSPADGEILVRNQWMSVDPYMRGRMIDQPSYIPPFQVGQALEGGAIGEVIESAAEGFAPGDLVMSMYGWREAYIATPRAPMVTKLPKIPGVPVQAFLGVLGVTGLTAYAGLLAIGEPKPGETVFVSGAAGAVGSIAAQIAKIKGCTVIGTAGTDEKCEWLRNAGVDHAINYRTCGKLLDAVRSAAPDGIDVYFDNVGGEHLEVALELSRPLGRFVECGMISMYNDEEPPAGPPNLVNVISRSLKVQGYVVSNYFHMQPEFLKDVSAWMAEGRLKAEETVVEGIEAAPEAFLTLFSGGNTGKMLVKL